MSTGLKLLAIAGMLLAVPDTNAYDTRTYHAHDFAESVGVNTHLRHGGSVYDTQFAKLKQRLLDAHIRHFRDGAMDQDGGFNKSQAADASLRFAELGRAGLRGTFIFRPLVSREFVTGWPARVAPAFEAYEPPNELNLDNSLPWVETLRLWMPRFHQYVASSGQNYPILAPSIADLGNEPYRLLGDQSANVDFGNIHKYYRDSNPGTDGYGKAGTPPCEPWHYGQLEYALCQAQRVSGSLPIMATEAGWPTAGKPGRYVSETLQARYLVRMLLVHFAAGVKRTFIYQLADHGTDAGGTMGLLDGSGNAKPAYRAVKTLMDELDDAAAPRRLVPLVPRLDGAPADTRVLMFQKADGTYRWVLWIEKPSPVQGQRVTVTVPAGFRAHRALSIGADGRASTVSVSGAKFSFTLTDSPTLIELGAP